MYDPIVEFRTARGMSLVLLPVSKIDHLRPEKRGIYTQMDYIIVCEEDWPKVEKAFRDAHQDWPTWEPSSHARQMIGIDQQSFGALYRTIVHGENCPKVPHDDPDKEYMHHAGWDAPYDFHGLRYCGRCHHHF